MIEEGLSLDSKMEKVVTEANLSLKKKDHQVYQTIQILKKSGGVLTLRLDYFLDMTVGRFIRIKGIDEDYTVII